MTFVLKKKRRRRREFFKCKDSGHRDLLLKMNKTISKGFYSVSIHLRDIHPFLTMAAWNMSALQQRVWLIIAVLWLPACHSSLWPANSSGIRSRSGWWLMSASVCNKPQLYAFCCSQTAHCYSQIWLISEVTVQLLNLASNNNIKGGERVWSALSSWHLKSKSSPNRSLKVSATFSHM